MSKIVDPKSNISTWNKSPQSFLCEHLCGCCAHVQYTDADHDHISSGKDHYIKIHRPEFLRKYTWLHSKELVFEVCTVSVESNARFRNSDTNAQWVTYKDYKTVYKNWCISNEIPKEALKYWQFVSTFLTEIIKWVKLASTKSKNLGWAAVSEDDAVDSLSEVYKIAI